MLVSDNPGDKTCPNKETETVSKVNNVGGGGGFTTWLTFVFVLFKILHYFLTLFYCTYYIGNEKEKL